MGSISTVASGRRISDSRAMLLALSFFLTASLACADEVTGELRLWHKVTLTVEGPATSEDAQMNPFRDFRMDVSFTHADSGHTIRVPGYFAADGNAAETSATAGNRWRAHLSPNREGQWHWQVSFRAGSDVAIANNPSAGDAWEPLDGSRGSFVIASSDKQVPDLRGRGTLEYVGDRYLRFAGDGGYFLKGGVDSPETLLGYADIDGTYLDRNTGTGRRLRTHRSACLPFKMASIATVLIWTTGAREIPSGKATKEKGSSVG